MGAFHRGLVMVVFGLMLLFFTFFVQGAWYYYGISVLLLIVGGILVKDGSYADEIVEHKESAKKRKSNKRVYKSSR